jgi:hypothetical protein
MASMNKIDNKADNYTVDYTKFEINKFTYTQLEENSRSKGQLVAYPKYDNNDFFFQGPWINLSTYGVPKTGEFYKKDDDRKHIRVPLDASNKNIPEFIKMLKSIDALMSQEDTKEKMFNKKSKKYAYQPIFRESVEQTEDSDSETEKPKKSTAVKLPYFKAVIDTEWSDPSENKPVVVKTPVFESIVDPNDSKKRIRTKLDTISSIDDFANAVPWKSNIRFIVRGTKLWAHPSTKKDPQYGIVFKLVKIEVEPTSTKTSMYKQIYENDNFIDDDDNSGDNVTELLQNTLKLDPVKEDSDSDSESDEEEVVLTKKGVKQIVEVASDSSDDDEPVKPKSKPVVKKQATKKK